MTEEFTMFNELLAAYDSNCLEAETRALEMISSFEIAVFNGFRDVTAQSCLKTLNQLSFHFGRENVIEHCVCLTILTEYICSAYNNKELYKTFEVPVSEKYVEKIFNQLYTEWMKLFRTELPREFTASCQFQSILKNLNSSANRLPNTSCYKLMLQKIVLRSEAYYNHMQTVTVPIKNEHTFAVKDKYDVLSFFPNNSENQKVTGTVLKTTKLKNYDIRQFVIRKANTAPQEFQIPGSSKFLISDKKINEARVPELEKCNNKDCDIVKEDKQCNIIKDTSNISSSKEKVNAFILMKWNTCGKSKCKRLLSKDMETELSRVSRADRY